MRLRQGPPPSLQGWPGQSKLRTMSSNQSEDESGQRTAAQFATTHWSVVLAAAKGESPQTREALEEPCRTYWYPLYAYVRRQGHNPEDAEDLTQSFFAYMSSPRHSSS
jgi:hypothetical protein